MNVDSDIQIGNAGASVWFVAGLLIVVVMIVAGWIRRRARMHFATRDRIEPIFGAGVRSRFRGAVRGVGFVLAIVFLAIGLMDFRWGKIQREVPQEGIEVMFLLDVSRSMLAEDVTPNRLERAKQMIRDMIDAMAGDRVGLVAFAGETRRMIPLTNHYEDFKTSLADIDPDSVRRGGSKLGNAIEVAGDGFLSKTNSQRIMVVLTDGEDQESEPTKVAKSLSEDQNIRIFTVGLGDMQSGAKIPDAETQRYIRYQGKPVLTKLNGEILKQVARVTGGAYVPAGTKQVDMKAIYDRYIAGIEKTDFNTAKIDAYEARFQLFAIPALVILLLEAWGMTATRGRGRFAVFGLIALMSSMSVHADEATRRLDNYNRGVEAYRNQDLPSAIEQFDSASYASDSDLSASSRYNGATARIAQVRAVMEESATNQGAPAAQQAAPDALRADLQTAIDSLRLALRMRPRWEDARANLEIAVHLLEQLSQQEPEQPKSQNQSQSEDEQNQSSDSSSDSEQENGPDRENDPKQKGKPEPEGQSEADNQSDPGDSQNEPADQTDPADQPSGTQSPDQRQSGKSPSGEQQTDEQQPSEQQQPSEPQKGELQSGTDEPTQQPTEPNTSIENTQSESMTEEEARKMLQAVRDRDMVRRFRQQQLRRSRQVPVDRDW